MDAGQGGASDGAGRDNNDICADSASVIWELVDTLHMIIGYRNEAISLRNLIRIADVKQERETARDRSQWLQTAQVCYMLHAVNGGKRMTVDDFLPEIYRDKNPKKNDEKKMNNETINELAKIFVRGRS